VIQIMTILHRAGRVPIDREAFSRDLGIRRKRPRIENAAHLKFIRSLPCLICGTHRDVQAAHIRAANPHYGKRGTGLGEKSADHWTVPLCVGHHCLQHRSNEMEYWTMQAIDPFKVALALFASSGDEEAGELIIKEARN
jgi:hypothetical protein